jgi:Protein of unknown function (DUF3108)
MIRAFLLTGLLWLVAREAFAFEVLPGAHASELHYGLYVLGVPVADAVLNLSQTASNYRIDLRFHTTGLASVVADDRMDTRTRGVFDADGPKPLEYDSSGKMRGQDRIVGLAWRDGAPLVTALSPLNAAEREDVPPALRAYTIDPLSSIMLLLRQAAVTGRCEGTARTYDGRRLQLFQARTAGEEELPSTRHSTYAGQSLRCDFTDRTLAGFRLGAGREDDQRVHHGTIWLSQVLPGTQRLPVRASVETRWLGNAMIYLLSATP